MPRIIDIDTSAPGYQTRLTQYNDIMAFWKPHLKVYFLLDAPAQEAWRQSDPFLRRILQVHRAITEASGDDL
jgi:hypothetical protein